MFRCLPFDFRQVYLAIKKVDLMSFCGLSFFIVNVFNLVNVRLQDNEQKMFIHTKGCVPQFEKWLQENLTVVAGIFIGIALLQVNESSDSV